MSDLLGIVREVGLVGTMALLAVGALVALVRSQAAELRRKDDLMLKLLERAARRGRKKS